MAEGIDVIVTNVERKEKKGEKELLNYLSSLDIDTLNRLMIIFGGSGRVTLKQVFKVTFAAAGLVGLVVGYPDMSLYWFKIYKAIILLIIFIISLSFWIRLRKNSTKKAIISQSYRLIPQQKIITLIQFVLQEKYKNLN